MKTENGTVLVAGFDFVNFIFCAFVRAALQWLSLDLYPYRPVCSVKACFFDSLPKFRGFADGEAKFLKGLFFGNVQIFLGDSDCSGWYGARGWLRRQSR